MKRQKCILLSESSQSEKGHKLYDSRYMTFWKSPNYGDSGGKKSVASRSYGGARDGEAEHRGFSRCESILYDTIMTTCHCTFVKTHRLHNTKMNLNVNYGFWMIMISCYGFIVINVLLWCRVSKVEEVR